MSVRTGLAFSESMRPVAHVGTLRANSKINLRMGSGIHSEARGLLFHVSNDTRLVFIQLTND